MIIIHEFNLTLILENLTQIHEFNTYTHNNRLSKKAFTGKN